MKEQDLVRLYQRGTARRGPDRADCVSPEALLAVAEQRGSEAERRRSIDHARACADCGEELELLRATRVVRDRGRIPHAGLALAASLVLAALGYYTLSRHRADAAGNNGDVQLVSPVGATDRLDSLVWRSVTNAASYSIELRNEDGTLVTRGTITDTMFVLPDSLRVTPGNTVYWTVSARLTDGTELRSVRRRVRLTNP